jgi:hypothetical protein
MGSGVGDNACDLAVRKHSALMQDHEVVAGRYLVEQMRGP